MAKKTDKLINSVNKELNDNNSKNKSSFLFGLFAFLTALAIIILIVVGFLTLIIKSNFNGIAENNRNQIGKIPILRRALPEVSEDYDPYDAENLTEKELLEMYDEFRKRNSELLRDIEDLEKTISELENAEDEYKTLENKYEKLKVDIENEKANIKEKQLKVEEKELIADRLIASENVEDFIEYFAMINPENAQKIYEELIVKQAIEQESIEFARIYQGMDAGAAAKIFEQLGDAKIDLVVYTLKNMNIKNAATILEEMDEVYAAKVTQKLSEEFGIVLE